MMLKKGGIFMRVLCILTDGYEELEAVGTIALDVHKRQV